MSSTDAAVLTEAEQIECYELYGYGVIDRILYESDRGKAVVFDLKTDRYYELLPNECAKSIQGAPKQGDETKKR